MTGTLTQSLANLTATEKTIGSLQGLPGTAKPVVKESAVLVTDITQKVKALQASAKAGMPKIDAGLAKALTDLDAGKPLSDVMVSVKAASAVAATLEAEAEAVSMTASKMRGTVAGFSQDLAKVAHGIDQEITTMNATLLMLESKRDAEQKRYYLLLLLGPFGLIGLAVALALYEEMKGNVDKLSQQIRDQEAQIQQAKSLIGAVKVLNKDFGILASNASGLQNALSFLSSDIAEIIDDLEHAEARSAIKAYIVAAQAEAKEVAEDAA